MVNFACSVILPSHITDSTYVTPSDCTLYPSMPPKMCLGAYLMMPVKPESLYVILFCFIMILILCLCCDLSYSSLPDCTILLYLIDILWL